MKSGMVSIWCLSGGRIHFGCEKAVSYVGLGVGLVSIFFGHERDSTRLYRLNRLPLKPKAYKEIRSFSCDCNKLRNDLVPNPTLSAIDQMYLQSQLDVAGSARSDAWGAKSNVVSSAYLS